MGFHEITFGYAINYSYLCGVKNEQGRFGMTREKRILIARYSKLLRKNVRNIGFGVSFRLARFKVDKASYSEVVNFLSGRGLFNGSDVIANTNLSVISNNGIVSFCRV